MKLLKVIVIFVGLIGCIPCMSYAQCPTTTYPLCSGESYTLTAQTGLTNIQWQMDNGAGYMAIAGANGNTYVATSVGKYRYLAKALRSNIGQY